MAHPLIPRAGRLLLLAGWLMAIAAAAGVGLR